MPRSVPAVPVAAKGARDYHPPAADKRAALKRIAQDVGRLEKEAAKAGEDFLAFLLANARSEADALLAPDAGRGDGAPE